eukprot:1611688-Pleurochrysis_carterae.AAC.1
MKITCTTQQQGQQEPELNATLASRAASTLQMANSASRSRARTTSCSSARIASQSRARSALPTDAICDWRMKSSSSRKMGRQAPSVRIALACRSIGSHDLLPATI